MSKPNVLSTKEVLLDHLYAVVSPMTPHARKVVGMLSDSPEDRLMTILGNYSLLEKTVDEAVLSLQKCEDNLCADRDTLGDELFHKVAELEPGLCAQITGMLLELDLLVIKRLLVDNVQLASAVEKARLEFMTKHQNQPVPLSDTISERLFEAVAELHQKNAPKITGMLSEHPEDVLDYLLQSPSEFKQKVLICRRALEDTKQWLPE